MTFFEKLFAASLLILSLACGGQVEPADERQNLKAPLSFEPFASFDAARARAHRYAANCSAVGLAGALARDRQAYQWSWTFQCDGRMYVVVSAAPGSVRIASHATRAYFLGVGTFEPARVNVSATDLVSLLRRQGYPLPDSMDLSAPLAQKMEPRWTASVSSKTLHVNALTGEIYG